jgi:hypothetical protein
VLVLYKINNNNSKIYSLAKCVSTRRERARRLEELIAAKRVIPSGRLRVKKGNINTV